MEETCIIDNLMNEIKNGFPLRKRNMQDSSSPTKKKTPDAKKEAGKSRKNWHKTKLLAAFLSKFCLQFRVDLVFINLIPCVLLSDLGTRF